MADLTNTVRWVRYEPDLLGNRALERPFYFELNGSMSKEQMRALEEALDKPLVAAGELAPLQETPTDEQRAAHAEKLRALNEASRAAAVEKYAIALAPYVKLGAESLNISGRGITALRDYLDFVSANLTGFAAFFEPAQALKQVNTLDTQASFFSGRLSGGFTSTTLRNGASGRSQTAAR